MNLNINFREIIANAGIPTTEPEIIENFRKIAADEKLIFNNTCSYSPFWRLMSLLVAKPMLWLIDLLAIEILPALFLKTAVGKWVDVFAWQLGLKRKAATKARGIITLRRAKAEGEQTIPIETFIQSASIGGNIYRLKTLADGKMIAGQNEIEIEVEAENFGEAYNLADGFYALLSTPLAGIVSITNQADWLLIPGADEENDDDLKARCRNQFNAINQWHIDASYIAMITKWPGINVNDIYIEHNAPRGPGSANLYILFDHGMPIKTYLDQLTQYVMTEGNHGFSDDVLIAEIPSRPYDFTVAILLSNLLTDADKAQLMTQIETYIRVALRDMPDSVYKPKRIVPQSRFVWSNLITELHQQFGGIESIDFGDDNDIKTGLWIPEVVSLKIEAMA